MQSKSGQMFDVNKLVRKNIRSLKPYSSAREEFKGEARVFLDANENGEQHVQLWRSFSGNDLRTNRYPDPRQLELKTAIGQMKDIGIDNIFLGNGSDECIDLLFRSFCEPSRDNVIIIDPTYGMYEVAAGINGVEARRAALNNDFQIDLKAVKNLVDVDTKIIWLCSPNNPTGNSLNKDDILYLLSGFDGLVVLDEAYIDYSSQPSFLPFLNKFPNLVILQTFSKAWGLAGLRLGMAFAAIEIVTILNKIKPPYNISTISQHYVLESIQGEAFLKDSLSKIEVAKTRLEATLRQLPFVKKVFLSDANFVLVRFNDARAVYQYLLSNGVVVRDRSNDTLCENCLRITVGSEKENDLLIQTLQKYQSFK